MSKPKVALFDGNWYLHRAYFVAALRRSYKFLEQSIPRHVLFMVLKDAKLIGATHVAVVFDAPNSFRYRIYPDYKNGRASKTVKEILATFGKDSAEVPNIEVYTFLEHTKKAIQYAGITCITVKDMEADDVMASGALSLANKGYPVLIASHDKDMMQVVSDRIKLYWPKQGRSPSRIIGPKEVKEIKGVNPEQIRDFLCLTGDSADNIPGVKGINKGKAKEILNQFGSVKKCLSSKTKHGEKLRRSVGRIKLAKKLVELNRTCWIAKLKEVELRSPKEKKVKEILGLVPKNLFDLHCAAKMRGSRGGLFR